MMALGWVGRSWGGASRGWCGSGKLASSWYGVKKTSSQGSAQHAYVAPLLNSCACPLSQAILDTLASVRARPVTPEERQEASEPLPPPMLQNNWESASDKCFIGPSFVQSVIESTNWEYRDEGKDKSRPKLGYISTTPGSILKIKVNTTSPTGNPQLPVRGVVCLGDGVGAFR